MRVGQLRIRLLLVLASVLCSCGNSFFPLEEGLAWTYQMSMETDYGRVSSVKMKIENMKKRELAGRQVTPQKVNLGGPTSFNFMVDDSEGIFEFASQGANSAEPAILSNPLFYLRHPLQVGTEWKIHRAPVFLKEPFTMSARIESIEETVTVPAGTFERCIKVVAAGVERGVLFGDNVEIKFDRSTWFCPGVGLVKHVRHEGRRSLSLQLESYSGGR